MQESLKRVYTGKRNGGVMDWCGKKRLIAGKGEGVEME
jgi:hypothetical protein